MKMTLDELAEKYCLSAEDRAMFSDYISNRFDSCVEIAETEQIPLKSWELLAMLSAAAGAAEIINKKLCPKYPVEFESPEKVRLEIYDSIAAGYR